MSAKLAQESDNRVSVQTREQGQSSATQPMCDIPSYWLHSFYSQEARAGDDTVVVGMLLGTSPHILECLGSSSLPTPGTSFLLTCTLAGSR